MVRSGRHCRVAMPEHAESFGPTGSARRAADHVAGELPISPVQALVPGRAVALYVLREARQPLIRRLSLAVCEAKLGHPDRRDTLLGDVAPHPVEVFLETAVPEPLATVRHRCAHLRGVCLEPRRRFLAHCADQPVPRANNARAVGAYLDAPILCERHIHDEAILAGEVVLPQQIADFCAPRAPRILVRLVDEIRLWKVQRNMLKVSAVIQAAD
mmetsp:Transcript_43245/g.125038  ORF Transcript_43245/g.125038 Transcript_43245/m.125038 type:complete len:214 (-) Transcript_43245:1148-1789(-)